MSSCVWCIVKDVLLCCAEHIISIAASLVKNCEGIQRQRLINKFVENDHEKIDRLMELHFKYLDRVNKADDKIEQKKRVSKRFMIVYFLTLPQMLILLYFTTDLYLIFSRLMMSNHNTSSV